MQRCRTVCASKPVFPFYATSTRPPIIARQDCACTDWPGGCCATLILLTGRRSGLQPKHSGELPRRGDGVRGCAAHRGVGGGRDAHVPPPCHHDACPAPGVRHDEVLGGIVADIDESVRRRSERPLDDLIAAWMRLGETAPAQ